MDLVVYWRQFMAAEGLSARTIEDRLGFLNRLQAAVGDVLTATRQDLIMWTAQQKWSSNTRVHYRSALHTFFTWLQDEGFRPDNPAARLPVARTTRRQPTPFSVDEIDRLMNSGIYAKTRAMIALHYYLGLRVSEISRVNGDDINWEARVLTTIGKGNKERALPIPAHLWEVCEQMPRTGYWFPNRQDNKHFKAWEGHIHGRSVSDTIGDAIRRAGMTHRPHDLRASTATQMHKAGINHFTIQKSMRHSQMQTTTVYLDIDMELIREGLNALPRVDIPTKVNRSKVA